MPLISMIGQMCIRDRGQPVKVEGMTSKTGKEFDATLQYSAERRGLEFIFPKKMCIRDRPNTEK